ncbi:1076_t:CDS:2, partial [Racocetra persica]
PESLGMTILLGMEFNNPEVTLLAEQVKRMTVATQLSQLDRILQLEKEQEDPRIRTGKISEAKTAEDKKAYLYKTISALTETKDAILWKNRDLIPRQIELCKSEPLQEQFQAKYRELLGVSLENLDKMHDDEDEKEQIFQEQIRARTKGLELPKTLPPRHPYHEEYQPTINEP